jgi:hypothetical protein
MDGATYMFHNEHSSKKECSYGRTWDDRHQSAWSTDWKTACDGEGAESLTEEFGPCQMVVSLRLRENCVGRSSFTPKRVEGKRRNTVMRVPIGENLKARHAYESRVPYLAYDEATMYESKELWFQELRRARHNGMREMAEVRELPCRHGFASGEYIVRSHRQFFGLSSRKLPMGYEGSAGEQPQDERVSCGFREENDARSVGVGAWFGNAVYPVEVEQRLDGRKNPIHSEPTHQIFLGD